MSLKQLIDEKNMSVYFSDKFSGHHYDQTYCDLFDPIKYSVKNVLEVGVQKGGSLLLWRDHFVNANIYGADIDLSKLEFIPNKEERITVYNGNAYDHNFINNILPKVKFDILLDDGSHLIEHMSFFVQHYHHLLSENGMLIVEDIAHFPHAQQLKDLLPPELQAKATIVDLRHIANRWDDVMLVVKK